ncbi:MAG: Sua5 family C-terminal domain-containing protein, partial [Verrucomicrobiota bacterium]
EERGRKENGPASPPDAPGPEPTLRSPGLLARHYCPQTPLRVDSWRDEAELGRRLAAGGWTPDEVWIIAHGAVPMSGRFPHVALIPADPEAYARALYAELHRADTAGRKWILVEAVPEDPAWAGIADRLRRAATAEPVDRPAGP